MLIELGFILLIIGVVATIKNGIPALRISHRKTGVLVLVAGIVLLGIGAPPPNEESTIPPAAGTDAPALPTPTVATPTPVPAEPTPAEEIMEPIPDALAYNGRGDDVIEIASPDGGPVLLYIQGNDAGRHFAVTGYDASGNRTTLFVNTTKAYEGTTLDPSGATTTLEIKAEGSWTVESRSIRSARTVEVPARVDGRGDDILLVEGGPKLARITGNQDSRHFAVLGYTPHSNLLVNTTDAYDGTVRVPPNTSLLQIKAVGHWSISLE